MLRCLSQGRPNSRTKTNPQTPTSSSALLQSLPADVLTGIGVFLDGVHGCPPEMYYRYQKVDAFGLPVVCNAPIAASCMAGRPFLMRWPLSAQLASLASITIAGYCQ